MASRRSGLPYIHATWLAKVLAGARCRWSYWFRANFSHVKFEEQASSLAEWNRNHTELMARRQQELEEAGWTCSVEETNKFRMAGQTAVVGGKPDLVATLEAIPNRHGRRVLVVDGKTGRRRDSDIEQVLIYLWALRLTRRDLQGASLEGEVFYAQGTRVDLSEADLDAARITREIKLLAGPTPLDKFPDREECRFCDIGPKDCPQRVMEREAVSVDAF